MSVAVWITQLVSDSIQEQISVEKIYNINYIILIHTYFRISQFVLISILAFLHNQNQQ